MKKAIKEEYIHYLWKNKLLLIYKLKLINGESIHVLDVGNHNENESGPDFLMASIKIDGVVWHGHVEIHVKASDWYKHQHHKDKNYNNVILHLVCTKDKDILQNGQLIPTVEIQELIDEKTLADAPIAVYKGEGVQKGVGRFGPFIKWNGVFINVSRKYNFDSLSQSDIEELIEDKLQKNIDKVLHDWKEEGIIVEKARWGRSVILKGKLKIELGKEIDAANLSLAQVQEIIAKKTPAKKSPAKKAVAKKVAQKKPTAKKK